MPTTEQDQGQDQSALAELAKPENIQVAPADSEEVKKLLSVMDALGDSMSQVDRAKFEGLIERARNQQA